MQLTQRNTVVATTEKKKFHDWIKKSKQNRSTGVWGNFFTANVR